MCFSGHKPVFCSSYNATSPCSAVTVATALPTLIPSWGSFQSLVFSQTTQPPTYKNDLIKKTVLFRRQQMFFLLSAAPGAQFPAKWRRNKISWFSEGLQWPDPRCIYLRGTAKGNQPWSKELMKLHLSAMPKGPAHTVPVYRQSSHFSQETPQKLTNPIHQQVEKALLTECGQTEFLVPFQSPLRSTRTWDVFFAVGL